MFTKILVPLDGSEDDEYALVPALTLAEDYGGTLFLLCTCADRLENGPSQDLANNEYWFWSGLSEEPIRNEQIEYLDHLTSRLPQRDVKIQSLFVRGDEAGAIIGIAEAQDIDLIIMPKQCRSREHRDELGQVTERVLHHASCSVMVICSTQPNKMTTNPSGDSRDQECGPETDSC